jgi:hypothetical protein
VLPKSDHAKRSRGDRRVLAIKDLDVADRLWIAKPAYERWHADNDGRSKRAPNIRWWSDWAGDLTARVEDVPPFAPPVTASLPGRAAAGDP